MAAVALMQYVRLDLVTAGPYMVCRQLQSTLKQYSLPKYS